MPTRVRRRFPLPRRPAHRRRRRCIFQTASAQSPPPPPTIQRTTTSIHARLEGRRPHAPPTSSRSRDRQERRPAKTTHRETSHASQERPASIDSAHKDRTPQGRGDLQRSESASQQSRDNNTKPHRKHYFEYHNRHERTLPASAPPSITQELQHTEASRLSRARCRMHEVVDLTRKKSISLPNILAFVVSGREPPAQQHLFSTPVNFDTFLGFQGDEISHSSAFASSAGNR